jgi:integrase
VIVRHLTVLHGIFKRAKRAYGLERNPASADLVERPKVIYTGEFDTFTGEEVELLAGAAHGEQDAALYRTAAFTGLRQGELLALRWADVDFLGGLLHVRRNYTDRREKMPKGKRVRSVPMTPPVVDALGRLKERGYLAEDGDLVFCNTAGAHLDAWALRRRYYRALEKAGLRRIRFHDLRHCFGSAAITKLDAYAVQSYMGHQHYSTTQRYLHHRPRPQDAQALHEAFGGRAPSRRDDAAIDEPADVHPSAQRP